MSQILSHNPAITKSCSVSISPFKCSTPSIFAIAFTHLRQPPHRIIFPSTCNGKKNRVIKCMATPKRVQMVTSQIMRVLSDMLVTDDVLQRAIMPEAALGADRYLSSVTTISDVEVSNDLQVVKVYVSVFGDERGKAFALAGLKAKTKYVRSQLGKRVRLRLTPEIRFLEDEAAERGSRVLAILDRIKEENEQKAREEGKGEGEAEDDQDLSDQSDDEWEGDQSDDEWEDDEPDNDEGVTFIK